MIIDLLKLIKVTGSSLEKIKLLKEYKEEVINRITEEKENLKELLKLVYDGNVIFGIKGSGIEIKSFGTNRSFPTSLYTDLLTCNGRNEKILKIRQVLSRYTPDVVEYFLRGLDKDLGIGINVKTIEKAFPKLIEPFEVMLAHLQTEKKFLKYFSELPWVYLNLKVDGIRCLVFCISKDEVIFISRNGKTIQPFLIENIKNEILENFEQYQGNVLDGEIFSKKFQQLMRVVNRKNVEVGSVEIRDSCKFAIFDILPISEFREKKKTLPLISRVDSLERLKTGRFIEILNYLKVKNDYALINKIARRYIDSGQEGIIVKAPKSVYEHKRSNFMLKFKDQKTEDLEIVSCFEGEKGTKYEGMLGGFTLKLSNGNTVNCGSGFTDEERKEFWKTKEEFVGKICEVEFMETTDDGSLRHPRFVTIRTDKE